MLGKFLSSSIIKHSLSTALVMVMFSLVGTGLLVYTYQSTLQAIAKSESEAKLKLFTQVLPQQEYDNDLLKDSKPLAKGGLLGNRDNTTAYIARLAGQPRAVILEALAPDGYSGDIKLLIAVRVDGSLAGVRVLAHKETPGLGDYIELAHGDWIRLFDGLSLESKPIKVWKVKKDGGDFDYMAGATITPRAVVKAVAKAMQYVAAHHVELFQSSVETPSPILDKLL